MSITYKAYSKKAGRIKTVKHKKHMTERSLIRQLYMNFDATTVVTCLEGDKVLEVNELCNFYNEPK